MSDEKLPIKFFSKREVDDLRVEGGGGNEPPKWLLSGNDLIKRAEILSSELNEFKNIVIKKEQKQSIVPFVFKAKLNGDRTAKSHRVEVSTFFRTDEKNNIIGVANINELVVKISTSKEINGISEKLSEYNQNQYAISCLENFELFRPDLILDKEDRKIDYKIKLIDFQEYEQNIAIHNLFEKLIVQHNIRFKKTDYAENYTIYNLKQINSGILDSLKTNEIFEAVFSIEPMPKYTVKLDSLESSETSIKIMQPNDNEKYVTIGILDNGIADIPHLKPWIDKRISSYPDQLIKASHGTFVAGVALYGDILQGEKWIGNNGFKLLDAAVFPDTTKEDLSEDDLIHNIQEVVRENCSDVKIWNLSISWSKMINNNSFSDFAIAIDSLQDECNVLICKSVGNCNGFLYGRPKDHIFEGADSVRSLSVGSLAHKKGKFDLADVDNPSPFTRIGPGPSYVIKPEVVHYGGNAGITDKGKVTQTGVKSFNKEGLLSSAVGTSFSTPRITALAAGLYQRIDEEFDPLLIKALIIHSANYPKNLHVPNNERTNQIGFGKPKSINEILYNSPSEVTLILRDNISKGEYIDIMDFPMPDCLISNGFYAGQVIVTLVYDPILEPTQRTEYCQSNIDIKFGSYDEKTKRDTSKRNILNPIGRKGTQNILRDSLYSKKIIKTNLSDFGLSERLLIQYGDKYYPVKKYAVDLSELTETNKLKYLGKDKHWFLSLKGLYRDYSEQKAYHENRTLSQEFCLIITIRDPNGKNKVYDNVTQKLSEYNFWYNNIRISNEVGINV